MKKTLLYILLVGVLFAFGCSADSRQDYLVNNSRLTFATNICTAVIKSGTANAETKLGMVTAVTIGDNCDENWWMYLIDPDNSLPPDMTCVTDAVIELLMLADVNDVPPMAAQEDISDETLTMARNRLVMTVDRFRKAVLQFGIKEE